MKDTIIIEKLTSIIIFGLSCLLVACVDDAAFDEEVDVGTASNELWSLEGTGYWPSGNVPVCVEAEGTWTDSDTDFLQYAAGVRSAIEGNYEEIPPAAIDFTGWEICPDGGVFGGGYRIKLYDDSGGSNSHLGYRGSTRESIMNIHTASYPSPDVVSLHEAVHGLGFHHEYRRNDRDGQCIGDSKTTLTGEFLTEYDPLSIANNTYCGLWNPWLTELDKLGLSIVYPASFTHPPAVSNSFQIEDRIVARTNSEISTTWMRDGATEDAFDAAPTWEYHTGGVVTAILGQYSFSFEGWPDSIRYMSASWDDFLGRRHTIPEFELEVNNALHSAILMAQNSAIL